MVCLAEDLPRRGGSPVFSPGVASDGRRPGALPGWASRSLARDGLSSLLSHRETEVEVLSEEGSL